MSQLDNIKACNCYAGDLVYNIYEIESIAVVEIRAVDGTPRFRSFVDGEARGGPIRNLDYAILQALAAKYHDIDSAKYASLAMGMSGAYE